MFDRPPLLEEPFAQTLSGKKSIHLPSSASPALAAWQSFQWMDPKLPEAKNFTKKKISVSGVPSCFMKTEDVSSSLPAANNIEWYMHIVDVQVEHIYIYNMI
jgi:hypothetical protein